ncbi:metallophosphoesterase [Holzapfeliella sp. He02]|uniref:Phosphoesterase n=1 Tax=Holzapfeliella saturejae TaxID=3082953 RepID=A0ABU8SJ36_9LACO
MTKLLIMSDTHGETSLMKQVIKRHQAEVDKVIHAGDGQFQSSGDVTDIIAVHGNMTEVIDLPDEAHLKIDDGGLLLMHGHLDDNIAYNPMRLQFKGLENQTNVLVFGHTHQPFVSYFDDLLLLNPGSLAKSRDVRLKATGTYAILTITSQKYMIDFYNQSGELLPSLSTQYQR